MKENLTKNKLNNLGFTIIEIIATLVILGILGALVVSKAGNFVSTNALVTEAEILKANLRYAQMMSMNTKASDIWQIIFITSDTEYKIQQYNSASSSWVDKNLAGESTSTHIFPNGVTASVNSTIRFDNWGIPVQSNRTTPVTADKTITLSGGSASRDIQVTKNTGFTYLP